MHAKWILVDPPIVSCAVCFFTRSAYQAFFRDPRYICMKMGTNPRNGRRRWRTNFSWNFWRASLLLPNGWLAQSLLDLLHCFSFSPLLDNSQIQFRKNFRVIQKCCVAKLVGVLQSNFFTKVSRRWIFLALVLRPEGLDFCAKCDFGGLPRKTNIDKCDTWKIRTVCKSGSPYEKLSV